MSGYFLACYICPLAAVSARIRRLRISSTTRSQQRHFPLFNGTSFPEATQATQETAQSRSSDAADHQLQTFPALRKRCSLWRHPSRRQQYFERSQQE